MPDAEKIALKVVQSAKKVADKGMPGSRGLLASGLSSGVCRVGEEVASGDVNTGLVVELYEFSKEELDA